MAIQYVCPQGHRWQLPSDGAASTDVSLVICPICGSDPNPTSTHDDSAAISSQPGKSAPILAVADEPSAPRRPQARRFHGWVIPIVVLAILVMFVLPLFLLVGVGIWAFVVRYQNTQVIAQEEADRAREEAEHARREAEAMRMEAELRGRFDRRAREELEAIRRAEQEALEDLKARLGKEPIRDLQGLEVRTREDYSRTMAAAAHEWKNQNKDQVRQLLDACPPDLRNWEWHHLRRLCQQQPSEMTLRGHEDRVLCLVFSPDGQRLFSASADGAVKTWDAGTGQEQAAVKVDSRQLRIAVLSPDGKRLVTTSQADSLLRMWDSTTGQPVHTLKGHTKTVTCAAFSPDGKGLATGSLDRTVKLWNPVNGQLNQSFDGHEWPVDWLGFTPNLRIVSSASGFDGKEHRGEVKTWMIEIGKGIGGWTKIRGTRALSPDGQRVASSFPSEDPLPGKTVKLWVLGTGELVHTLEGHRGAVNAMAFSPDGQRLVTGGDHVEDQQAQSEVRVWDTLTGKELLSFTGLPQRVQCLAFSPDGRRLAAACTEDGKAAEIKIWNASPMPGEK